MTRGEAIKILNDIIDEGWLISDFDKCTAIDACDMAIKALEEPCEDMERKIEKEYLFESLCEDLKKLQAENEQLSSELEKNSQKLEKDFGELDYISRADAQTEIEMNASRYTIARERGGMGQVEWSDQLIKVSDAVDIIRDLPSLTPQEQKKWIPVSERLPEEHIIADGYIEPSDYVLVQMKSGLMHVTRYWGNRQCMAYEDWLDLHYPTTDEVIAWQPLPKPYSEVEQ